MKNLMVSADLGKENVCPSSSSALVGPAAMAASRTQRSEGRSPLPQGFPRAPLQDITHVLSPLAPLNILADDNDDDYTSSCTSRPKRSKCSIVSNRYSTKTQNRVVLTQCKSVQTIIRVSESVVSGTTHHVDEEATKVVEVLRVEDKREEIKDESEGKKEEKTNTVKDKEICRENIQTEDIKNQTGEQNKESTSAEVLAVSEKQVDECRNREVVSDDLKLSSSSSSVSSITPMVEISIEAPQKRTRRGSDALNVHHSLSYSKVTRKSDEKARTSVLKFR